MLHGLSAAGRPLLDGVLDRPAVANWATVFVAIAVQALPFLVLGVGISAAVAALMPAGFLPRALPSRSTLAVPVAAVAGTARRRTSRSRGRRRGLSSGGGPTGARGSSGGGRRR